MPLKRPARFRLRERRPAPRRWGEPLALALAMLLAACGLSSPSLDEAFEKGLGQAEDPLPPYRKLVAAALKSFKEQGDLTNLEISEPRWADHMGGPAWLVCVKFNPAANSYHYAFFIRKDQVIDSRYAVGTDRCAQRTFSSFDAASTK